MKLVEDKLKQLEKEKQSINDAGLAIAYLSQEIRKNVSDSVEKANSTDSVDQRLQSLLAGLQTIMDTTNNFGNEHVKKLFVLDAKIAVLEEILESYLSDASEEDENEEHELS